jgi:predicted nucleotidyltransferase
MIPLVEGKSAEVAELCGRLGVERLDLFDSATGEGFDLEPSDLDFVVTFERRDPREFFERSFGLEEDLEALFRCTVKLVMEGALEKSRRFAANVEASRMFLCGA